MKSPSLVVLHYTGMHSAAISEARLCEAAAQVSAHWLIDCDGQAVGLVDETMRAWHAGVASWAGLDDINSHSIGIELQNRGNHPFAALQMNALEELLAAIMARWSIPPQGVIAHSDIAPTRKIDPGTYFDWQRLARQNLSVWPNVCAADLPGLGEQAASAAQSDQFLLDLRRFGYPAAADYVLRDAFRLRFRPWGQGAVRVIDCAMAADLALRFGGKID